MLTQCDADGLMNGEPQQSRTIIGTLLVRVPLSRGADHVRRFQHVSLLRTSSGVFSPWLRFVGSFIASEEQAPLLAALLRGHLGHRSRRESNREHEGRAAPFGVPFGNPSVRSAKKERPRTRQQTTAPKSFSALCVARIRLSWSAFDGRSVVRLMWSAALLLTAACVVVPLGAAGEALTVTAGARHTCAIDAADRLHCWGDDAEG